jgi:hypothetical protein
MCRYDTIQFHTTAQLGELVVAALERSSDGSDPREAAYLATRAVIHMLRHSHRVVAARRRSDTTPLAMPSR